MNTKKVSTFHPFRSETAKNEYLGFYKTRTMKWPFSFEEKMYHTSFGETYVRINGPIDGKPLVLMHGGGDNSSSWAPNIEPLAKYYRTYAIDLINSSNMSVCTKPIKGLNEILAWMNELFDCMELKSKINILGMSYGSYLSARYMLLNPERIAKAVLIAPPNFVIRNSGAFVRGMLSTILPGRHFTGKFFYWLFDDLAKHGGQKGRDIIELFIDNAMLIRKCYTIQKFINPVVFTKEELLRLTMPTCFMIGENDKNYSAVEAIRRLNQDAPNIKTEIFYNAGHDLPILLAESVNEKILKFFMAE